MKDHPNSGLYWASLGVIFLVFILATFLRVPFGWGVNFLKFYPLIIGIAVAILFVLLAIPAVSESVYRGLIKTSEILKTGKNIRCGFLMLFIFAALIAFYALRTATTFLGDGQVRLNEIAFGRIFLPTEFLDFLLHSVLFHEILFPYALRPIVGYQIISIASGALFIFGVYRLSRYLFPDSFLIGFIILFSSGILALFFGYIESYSIIAALLPFIFLEGLKAAVDPARYKRYLLLYLLAGLIHSVALLLLAPSLVFILLRRFDTKRNRESEHTGLLLVGLLGLLILLFIARYFQLPGFMRYILAVLPNLNSPQAILTERHLTNLLNWIFLAALPIIIMLPDLLSKWGRPVKPSISTRYGLWIALPAFLFIFIMTPQLGGPRDWDLFAIPAFILLMGIVTAYTELGQKSLPAAIIPAAFLSLVLTFAFAGINHSVSMSATRFAEIIEVQKFRDLFNEYSLLSSYAGDHNAIKGRRLEFTLKSWEEAPHTEIDTMRTLLKLGAAYNALGKSGAALHYFQRSLSIDSMNLVALHYLIEYYRFLGKFPELTHLAITTEEIFRNNARGQMEAGMLYFELDDTANGQACLRRAYLLDSADIFVMVNYGVMQLRQSRFPDAVRILERAVRKTPKYYTANFNLALAYLGAQNYSQAAEYLARAEKLASTPAESIRVAIFKKDSGKSGDFAKDY